jgi:hypothetical protein
VSPGAAEAQGRGRLRDDLLAKRWVRYAYFYPFAEAIAGVQMVAGVGMWVSIPLALFIGTVGAVSVFKAVYVDRRELKCACVGGDSNVPLGFVSLTENLMMVAMALWPRSPTLDALSAAPGTAQRTCSHRPSCVHAGHDAVLLRARGKPASLRAAAICSCEAEVWTSTRRVGGSVTILALGSIIWIVFVTVRAQPPQVMSSRWNCMENSFRVGVFEVCSLPPLEGQSLFASPPHQPAECS